MQELDVTWGRTGRIWWLVLWRGVLGGTILGAAAGGAFGFIIGMLGLSPEIISIGSPLLGLIISLFWGLFVLRMALRKVYSDFRIVLVPPS